jgi:hypothetical protein
LFTACSAAFFPGLRCIFLPKTRLSGQKDVPRGGAVVNSGVQKIVADWRIMPYTIRKVTESGEKCHFSTF